MTKHFIVIIVAVIIAAAAFSVGYRVGLSDGLDKRWSDTFVQYLEAGNV